MPKGALNLGAVLLLWIATPHGLWGQGDPTTLPQTQADDYTRYELQEPGSGAFRIFYDVTATTPGKTHYFNTIRVGAEEEVHGVTDLMTGLLVWLSSTEHTPVSRACSRNRRAFTNFHISPIDAVAAAADWRGWLAGNIL